MYWRLTAKYHRPLRLCKKSGNCAKTHLKYLLLQMSSNLYFFVHALFSDLSFNHGHHSVPPLQDLHMSSQFTFFLQKVDMQVSSLF